jgi:SAM-dependent methyltransferase
VIATDASEKQIANAQGHERVEYQVAAAEESKLKSTSVDLVMVAQALHWLDFSQFYDEVRRVLKADGVFAASAYLFAQIEPAIDAVVNWYYSEVVGSFWAPERKLVENFAEIPIPFQKIDAPKFEMTAQWNLDELIGYLRTWSATQRFVAATQRDPLDEIARELRDAWGTPNQPRKIVWSLTLRVGIKGRGS